MYYLLCCFDRRPGRFGALFAVMPYQGVISSSVSRLIITYNTYGFLSSGSCCMLERASERARERERERERGREGGREGEREREREREYIHFLYCFFFTISTNPSQHQHGQNQDNEDADNNTSAAVTGRPLQEVDSPTSTENVPNRRRAEQTPTCGKGKPRAICLNNVWNPTETEKSEQTKN